MKRSLPIALVAALALCLFAIPAFAHDAGSAFELVATKASKAPVLDGNLDDAAWLEAALSNAIASGFVDHTGSRLLTNQSIAHVVWTDEALYVAMVNFRDMSKVTMFNDGGLSFGSEEENELYFDVDHKHILHVQYAWDAYGAVWASDGNTSGMEAVTKHTDYGWVAEVKIPWSILKVTPEQGKLIGMNINGYNTQDMAYFTWSPTYGSFANPPRFGGLVLGGPLVR